MRAQQFIIGAASFGTWSLFLFLFRHDLRVRRHSRPHRHKDQKLNTRVRQEIERSGVVSNPGAVVVRSSNGYVTLSGDVFWPEVNPLMSRVRAMPGVKGVRNSLSVHQSADGVAALQGRPFPASPNTPGVLF
ncbi:MAG: BON domain-containing protein [Bdellovibrionales bacterium]